MKIPFAGLFAKKKPKGPPRPPAPASPVTGPVTGLHQRPNHKRRGWRASIHTTEALSLGLIGIAVLSAAGALMLFLTALDPPNARVIADTTARATVVRIHDTLSLTRQIIAPLAASSTVVQTFKTNAAEQSELLGAALQQRIPNALKVRLLPTGTKQPAPDQIPPFEYVCIDLLTRAESGKPLPHAELHLPGTPGAHVDLVWPVSDPDQGGQVIGHLLVSLDPKAIQALVKAEETGVARYLELRQVSGEKHLVMASAGDSGLVATGEPVLQNVPNTPWTLAVWSAPPPFALDPTDLLIYGGAAAGIALLLLLAVIIPMRLLSSAFAKDSATLANLMSDARGGKLHAAYPFRLAEFQDLASEVRSSAKDMINEKQILENLMRADSMTGLASQQSFTMRLGQLLTQAHTGFLSTVMVADIDHLRTINEGFGQDGGDAVIKAFAAALKEGIRQSDFAARLEGGRFAVLFPFTEIDNILQLAERLRQKIPGTIELADGRQAPFAWSAGLSIMSAGDADATTVMTRATMALQDARQSGGGRIAVMRPA
jgi:diguanylate cyclase (GGDEF)-like protein